MSAEDSEDLFSTGSVPDEGSEEEEGEIEVPEERPSPPKKRAKTTQQDSRRKSPEATTKSKVVGTTAETAMDLASDNSSDCSEDLFATESPVKKTTTTTTRNPELLEHAKQRLSKWAARLFDPNRPRGLVQAPEVIPLNDEFLSAFGQRTKNYDEMTGQVLDVDTTIPSDDENDDNDNENTEMKNKNDKKTSNSKSNNKNKKEATGVKLKLTNLPYRMTDVVLKQACERYGPLLEVHLVMDDNNADLNSGRAYVTFQDQDSAESCLEGLKTLSGRPVRISMANQKPQSGDKNNNPNNNNQSATTATSQSLLNRYWEKDISTVCYRCGGVGHKEPDCKNPAKPKPCTLCGDLDHDMRNCSCKQICFNCGIPGHVSRDCTFRRGLPKRVICSICFQGGHHRLTCRMGSSSSHGLQEESSAICMVCKQPGHFSCQPMKWFFGLQGMSCFNCGLQGHLGYDCPRPTLHQCQNDPQLTNSELERAGIHSVAEILQQVQDQQRPPPPIARGRQMDRGNRGGGDRGYPQHKSLPPQRGGGGGGYNNRRNSGGDGGGDRGYPASGGGGGGGGKLPPQNRGRGYR